jgi:hypothetical protein
MMIDGVIELENPTKPSYVVLLLPDFEPTSRETWRTTILSEWLKSCCYSGESQPGDVGGRASS